MNKQRKNPTMNEQRKNATMNEQRKNPIRDQQQKCDHELTQKNLKRKTGCNEMVEKTALALQRMISLHFFLFLSYP